MRGKDMYIEREIERGGEGRDVKDRNKERREMK